MTAALEAVHADRVAADGLGLERVAHAGALWITFTLASCSTGEPLLRVVARGLNHFDAAVEDGVDVARVVGAADDGQEGEVHPGTVCRSGRGTSRSPRPAAGVGWVRPVMMPNPPALLTAAAEFSEPDVVHAALDDGVLDAEQFGDARFSWAVLSGEGVGEGRDRQRGGWPRTIVRKSN